MSDASRPPLRLIRGGRDGSRWGGVKVCVRRGREGPPLAAVVREEDRYLVLSAPVDVRERPEHPIRLMTALLDVQPAVPGSVVVRPGRPLELLAVVHDLDRDPTCREAWVATALESIVDVAEEHRLDGLAMQPLGCVHGRLPEVRFLALLQDVLERRRPGTLRRIGLLPPPVIESRLSRLLAEG